MGSSSVNFNKIFNDGMGFVSNKFSEIKAVSSSKIDAVVPKWKAAMPCWKASGASASKEASPLSQKNLTPAQVGAGALLITLPILGVVAWCMTPVALPANSGTSSNSSSLNSTSVVQNEEQPLTVQTALNHSSSIFPETRPAVDDEKLVELARKNMNEKQLGELFKTLIAEEPAAVDEIAQKSMNEKQSGELLGTLVSEKPVDAKPVADCARIDEQTLQYVTKEEIDEIGRNLKEKKNYREAFEAVLASSKDRNYHHVVRQSTMNIINWLIDERVCIPEITHLAKTWAGYKVPKEGYTLHMHAFNIGMRLLANGLENEPRQIANQLDDIHYAEILGREISLKFPKK